MIDSIIDLADRVINGPAEDNFSTTCRIIVNIGNSAGFKNSPLSIIVVIAKDIRAIFEIIRINLPVIVIIYEVCFGIGWIGYLRRLVIRIAGRPNILIAGNTVITTARQ